jgi:Holliday junction resolvase RusA-like endonuclease
MYTDKATRAYEQAIKDAYVAAGGVLHEGPVNLSVTFKNDNITITINDIEAESSLRGDLDNYIKSIMDGLNGVAYLDDKQVLNIRANKR